MLRQDIAKLGRKHGKRRTRRHRALGRIVDMHGEVYAPISGSSSAN
jgi:hypothetical protein